MNKLGVAGALIGGLSVVSLIFATVIYREIAVGDVEYTDPTTGEKKDCRVGYLGVFKSDYEPDCANYPGTAFTSDTLEYWPMFPAQNKYSGESFATELNGLGTSDFTNCDEYVTTSYNQVAALGPAVVSEPLIGAVAAMFSGYDSLVPTLPPMVYDNLGYNKTHFQDTDFAAVATALGSAPLDALTNLNALVEETCRGNGNVVTSADCDVLLVPLLSSPAAATTRTFQSALGTTYSDYIAWFGDLFAIASALLPTQAETIGGIFAVASQCEATNLLVTETCSLGAAVPSDLSAPNYLGSVLFTSIAATDKSFFDFCSGVRVSSSATFAPFNETCGAILFQCAAASTPITDSTECLSLNAGFQTALVVFEGFHSNVDPKVSGTDPTTYLNALIAQCKSDEESLDAIEGAQTAILVALIAGGIGFVTAVGGLAKDIKIVRGVAGVLLATSGVLTLVALLNVYDAPVYALVGERCAAGETCYTSGTSIPLALCAIASGAFAGCLLLASICFGNGTSEEESDKVAAY